MTVPMTMTSPEIDRAEAADRRFRLRYEIGVLVTAGMLIVGGIVVRPVGTGPIEGVDLSSPPHYSDVSRPPFVNGRYELFGARAKWVKLSDIPEDRRLPINVSDNELVVVTWDPEDDPPTHEVGQFQSKLVFQGETAVVWSRGSSVALFAGPEGRQLVPVSRHALEQGRAIKLT